MLIPFSGWEISDIGWFCGSAYVCCRDRNSQRNEFYRWSGRSCIQRHRTGRNLFTVVAIGTKSGIEPITCAVVGALMGFFCLMSILQVCFMGDTGSLHLRICGIDAHMMQMPLFA